MSETKDYFVGEYYHNNSEKALGVCMVSKNNIVLISFFNEYNRVYINKSLSNYIIVRNKLNRKDKDGKDEVIDNPDYIQMNAIYNLKLSGE